jgi:hypothetical protein
MFSRGRPKMKFSVSRGAPTGSWKRLGAAVVVVGDLRNYFINEIHQPYIDASLFAMTMMFAFHGQGMDRSP